MIRSVQAVPSNSQVSLYTPSGAGSHRYPEKSTDTCLYLSHRFEGRPLVRDYIANTMLGIEYLWGGTVKLETSEAKPSAAPKKQPATLFPLPQAAGESEQRSWSWERVVYTMEKRKLSRAAM